jgi:hypothetical protein
LYSTNGYKNPYAMTQKELQQKHIKETIASVQRNADAFKTDRNKYESEWDRYFNEILKYSPDFQLKRTPRTQNWQVQPYVVDAEGKFSYNSSRVLVGEISVDYNDMEIVYTGKLPEGENSRIRVYVEEHKTTPRGSWRTVNHGYKLKVTCNWEDDKKYFKTGRPVVQKVQEYIQGLWNTHNHKQKQAELRTRAFKMAFDKYWGLNTEVNFGGRNERGISSNVNNIVVTHKNGSVIVLSFKEVNDEVVFTIDRTYMGDNSVDSIIEVLGKMK